MFDRQPSILTESGVGSLDAGESKMAGFQGAEDMVDGSIVIQVEAAPQGLIHYTLDPEGVGQIWEAMLVAHEDSVVGAARAPEEAAHVLVRGSIECIKRQIPSLEVGGVRMWPERGRDGSAQIHAEGGARYLPSEWDSVKRDSPGLG
ncbi:MULTISPECIES: hypothetical protein [unclassified Microbacterium]|uniref:hypothetical protein n=1 Tax=unclassified Microbacterium TaxID=2609290 RepID=UPI002882D65C|nr:MULTISPECIES: hypothetical protein [unclassified Microbacterium]